MKTYAGHEDVLARMKARPKGCLRCGSVRRDSKQCWLEAGHTDLPHVFVTHHVTDGNGGYSGLGWAEWGQSGELIHLPPRKCPHEAEDRKTCRHIECQAWRAAVIEWATKREKADT